jgi:prefoldin subunit 5
MKAAESEAIESRSTSRNIVAEATLRADLGMMTSQRDMARSEAAEHKRKAALLDDELHQVKNKLARVSQEKNQLQRDQRVAMSMEKSLNQHSNANSDAVDYYKRKVAELNGYIQGLNATLVEKDRVIGDMSRQIERSLNRTSSSTSSRHR